MGLQEQITEAAIQHWPLVALVVWGGWWGFPHMFKKTLMNGGGDIIRGIVKTENQIQSKLHKEEMEGIVAQAIRNHEEVEKVHVKLALEELRAEITDRYELQPPIKRKGSR